MVLMSHIIVLTSHMMVPTITLFGTLNFYLFFKFNIYKKSYNTNITWDSTNITYLNSFVSCACTNNAWGGVRGTDSGVEWRQMLGWQVLSHMDIQWYAHPCGWGLGSLKRRMRAQIDDMRERERERKATIFLKLFFVKTNGVSQMHLKLALKVNMLYSLFLC